jgi:hypothetical protein
MTTATVLRLVLLLLATMAGNAFAVNTLSIWSTGSQSFPPGANDRYLQLGNSATAAFSTSTANAFVVITFNAVCSVGGGPANYLDIDIVVDQGTANQVIAGPTSGTETALCSGDSTATASDGRSAAIVIGQLRVPKAGSHTLKVRARGFGSSPISWRVGPYHVIIVVYE